MAKPLVTDELWETIEPLLPEESSPKPKGGRPRVPDRAALTGILFVLKTGIPWEMLLPQEMGCGSGMTCWRRLEEWHEAGGYGSGSTRRCRIASVRRTRSTGSGRPWTRRR
jgi:transposase